MRASFDINFFREVRVFVGDYVFLFDDAFQVVGCFFQRLSFSVALFSKKYLLKCLICWVVGD